MWRNNRLIGGLIMVAALAIPDVDDTADFRAAYAAFRPRADVRMLDWCVDNVVTDEGRAYDHAAYPHLGAPGGPFDHYDDPHCRTVALQWATRLGKTFSGQCFLVKTAACDPAPMIFASAAESLLKRSLARCYQMIRKRPQLRDLLKYQSENKQKQDLIEFNECQIAGAWARSTTSLADMNRKIGHAGEIDKWEHLSTSKESDPQKLFDDRFKDLQHVRKVTYESTPAFKNSSRVERLRLAGSNCSFYVPCPHCKKYQTLEFGDGKEPGGMRFGRDQSGRHDETIAKATAYYECRHCGKKCGNDHRSWMMRRGVWAPDGCGIKDKTALRMTEKLLRDRSGYRWQGWKQAKWISGTPLRDGEAFSSQLSSLYALSLDWGDIAKEFVGTRGKPHLFRNFIQQWLAQTWDVRENQQTWEQLHQRMVIDVPQGVVPLGFSLVTMGIDKQKDHYVYDVEAWAEGQASHTVAYGTCESIEELENVLRTRWSHQDGGDAVPLKLALIDSGYRPADVFALVRACKKKRIPLMACRGSSTALTSYYQKKKNGPKTSAPGMWVVWVDTNSTQDRLEQQLHSLKPEDPGGASLYSASAGEHQDYLEQLLNDAAFSDLDGKNNVRENWQRIDEDTPNDYRDAKRYAFVAMLAGTRGGRIRPRAGLQVPAGEAMDLAAAQKMTLKPRLTLQRPQLAPGKKSRR